MILLHEGFVKSKSGLKYSYVKGNITYLITVSERGVKVISLNKVIDNVDVEMKIYYSQLFMQECSDDENVSHYAKESAANRNTYTQTTNSYEKIWQYQPDVKRIVIKTTSKL